MSACTRSARSCTVSPAESALRSGRDSTLLCSPERVSNNTDADAKSGSHVDGRVARMAASWNSHVRRSSSRAGEGKTLRWSSSPDKLKRQGKGPEFCALEGKATVQVVEKVVEEPVARKLVGEFESLAMQDDTQKCAELEDGGSRLPCFNVGAACETVRNVTMRKEELMDSEIVHRLRAVTQLQVLEVGSGSMGRRIRVSDNQGHNGWVSITSVAGLVLIREIAGLVKSVAALDDAEESTGMSDNDGLHCSSGAECDSESGTDCQLFSGHVPSLQNDSATGKDSLVPHFGVGAVCETLRNVTMRKEEPMDSEIVHRLPAVTRVDVLEEGTEPKGRRIRVCDNQGHTGWVSITSMAGLILIREIAGSVENVPVNAEENKGTSDNDGDGSHCPSGTECDSESGTDSQLGFGAGAMCETVRSVTMRKEEAMASEIVHKLGPVTGLEVLEVGKEPTGRRIRVSDEQGHTGWVSVTSKAGLVLIRETGSNDQSSDQSSSSAMLEVAQSTAALPFLSVQGVARLVDTLVRSLPSAQISTDDVQ